MLRIIESKYNFISFISIVGSALLSSSKSTFSWIKIIKKPDKFSRKSLKKKMKNTLLISALLLACVACTSTVTYCVQYDAAGKCTECRGGFYLGSDGLCHAQCKGLCTVPNCS